MAQRDSAKLGSGDTVLMYADTGNNFYVCYGAPGLSSASTGWAIAYVTDDGANTLTKKWASGSPSYNFIADNRASYSYS